MTVSVASYSMCRLNISLTVCLTRSWDINWRDCFFKVIKSLSYGCFSRVVINK